MHETIIDNAKGLQLIFLSNKVMKSWDKECGIWKEGNVETPNTNNWYDVSTLRRIQQAIDTYEPEASKYLLRLLCIFAKFTSQKF